MLLTCEYNRLKVKLLKLEEQSVCIFRITHLIIKITCDVYGPSHTCVFVSVCARVAVSF